MNRPTWIVFRDPGLSDQRECVLTFPAFREPLFYLVMAQKRKTGDAANSHMPKKLWSATFKWTGKNSQLKERKKKKLYAEVARIYSKKLWRRKKEICACFDITGHKCLVKMEKPLNLYKMFSERDLIHTTFITVCFYNFSILLLVIFVNLLQCLIYKLNFIIDMYIYKKCCKWGSVLPIVSHIHCGS